ncbi:sulfotransferase domain-containing protein [Vreelandella sp. EE27]
MIENLFLCVGAQKSGTTWLHSQLENHPDVGFSDVKEVHYFNTIHNGSVLLTRRKIDHLERLVKNNRSALEKYFTNLSQGKSVDEGIKRLLSPVDDQWYIDIFKRNTKKYAADFSPEYALLPKAGFDNIKKVSKNQKIIFMMRDPLSRSKSAIQYYFQMNDIQPESVTDSMVWDVASKDFIIKMSLYDKTISSLKESFAENQLKLMFFEDVMIDKQSAANEIYDFLNIDHVPLVEEKAEERVNSSKKVDFPDGVEDFLLSKLKETYSYMRANFSNLPESWLN